MPPLTDRGTTCRHYAPEVSAHIMLKFLRGYVPYLRQPQQPPQPPKQLHDFPPEILLMITEHCSPYECTMLALSCKSLHELLRAMYQKEWKKYSPRRRLQCLWQVWWGIPLLDHYLCLRCSKLHRNDLRDAPGALQCRGTKILPRAIDADGHESRNSWARLYGLRQHHVAVAMRYHHSDDLHQQHRAHQDLILRPFTTHHRFGNHCNVEFAAWPIIVEFTFILVTKWVFSTNGLRNMFGDLQAESFRIFPHQVYPTNITRASPIYSMTSVIHCQINGMLNYSCSRGMGLIARIVGLTSG